MTTKPLKTLEEPLDPPELFQCDRCAARGKFLVVLTSGLDLVFCGHHTDQYKWNIVGVRDVYDLDN